MRVNNSLCRPTINALFSNYVASALCCVQKVVWSVAYDERVIYEVTLVFVLAGEIAISSYSTCCNKNRLSADCREWCGYVSHWTVKGTV